MYGYSRIKKVSTTRSKSLDLADLSFLPHTPRSMANHYKSKSKSQKNKPNHHINKTITSMHDSVQGHEQEDGVGEIFGIILSRKFPVSSSSCQKTDVVDEIQSSAFPPVVKKSLSLKRSASVSEGYYCRMHHKCELTTAAADSDDDQRAIKYTSQNKFLKTKGKLLNTCRRLFGL